MPIDANLITEVFRFCSLIKIIWSTNAECFINLFNSSQRYKEIGVDRSQNDFYKKTSFFVKIYMTKYSFIKNCKYILFEV